MIIIAHVNYEKNQGLTVSRANPESKSFLEMENSPKAY